MLLAAAVSTDLKRKCLYPASQPLLGPRSSSCGTVTTIVGMSRGFELS